MHLDLGVGLRVLHTGGKVALLLDGEGRGKASVSGVFWIGVEGYNTEGRDGYGWVWNWRWLTVVCVREPNLPPSAVRMVDVRASKAPAPPSLHRQCYIVSPHMLVCSGGGVMGHAGLGWKGHGHMGSPHLFPVAVHTCLLACAPRFNPSSCPSPPPAAVLSPSLCLDTVRGAA